jgi:hypothetical protein
MSYMRAPLIRMHDIITSELTASTKLMLRAVRNVYLIILDALD